jgi:hypothetical protein
MLSTIQSPSLAAARSIRWEPANGRLETQNAGSDGGLLSSDLLDSPSIWLE